MLGGEQRHGIVIDQQRLAELQAALRRGEQGPDDILGVHHAQEHRRHHALVQNRLGEVHHLDRLGRVQVHIGDEVVGGTQGASKSRFLGGLAAQPLGIGGKDHQSRGGVNHVNGAELPEGIAKGAQELPQAAHLLAVGDGQPILGGGALVAQAAGRVP